MPVGVYSGGVKIYTGAEPAVVAGEMEKPRKLHRPSRQATHRNGGIAAISNRDSAELLLRQVKRPERLDDAMYYWRNG